MAQLRVVHHINQFFAGQGGEEKADMLPGSKEGPLGPGAALQAALGDKGKVVGTVWVGDNYLAEHPDQGIPKVVDLIKSFKPDVVVSGPTFQAGRYGLNCGATCVMVQEKLGIPAVSGMHEENAGVEMYKSRVYIVQTKDSAAGMNDALKGMAQLAVKLANKEAIGTPEEEGYIPQRKRVYQRAEQSAASRAIDMVLKRVMGQPYVTEWPLPKYTSVTPPPALQDMKRKKLALITTGAVVPKGNPDKLQAGTANKWLKYNVYETNDLTSDRWESVHAGFNTSNVNEDPDRVLPVDVMRELEKEGTFGELHDFFYTTGIARVVPLARKFGQEMAKDLKEAGVEGVVLTST